MNLSTAVLCWCALISAAFLLLGEHSKKSTIQRADREHVLSILAPTAPHQTNKNLTVVQAQSTTERGYVWVPIPGIREPVAVPGGKWEYAGDLDGLIHVNQQWGKKIRFFCSQFQGCWDQDWRLYLAMIRIESNGNPEAHSGDDAASLAQLIPGTAKDMGVGMRWNPDQSLWGGAHYIDFIVQHYRYTDPIRLALAYHSGPGAVSAYDRNGSVGPNGSVHVALVTRAYQLAVANPQFFPL